MKIIFTTTFNAVIDGRQWLPADQAGYAVSLGEAAFFDTAPCTGYRHCQAVFEHKQKDTAKTGRLGSGVPLAVGGKPV